MPLRTVFGSQEASLMPLRTVLRSQEASNASQNSKGRARRPLMPLRTVLGAGGMTHRLVMYPPAVPRWCHLLVMYPPAVPGWYMPSSLLPAVPGWYMSLLRRRVIAC